jgi:26S proteasome regulatory subunit T1
MCVIGKPKWSTSDLQGQGPYSLALKKIENELKEIQKRVNEKMGVRESDTGLASPNLWDVPADVQRTKEHPLQVARCQTIMRSTGEVPRFDRLVS